MCGIAGFFNARVEDTKIQSLLRVLRHRGPDDQQFYRNGDVGFVHTRLSIIELSPLGAQPYRFENLVLVFNGELYNYKEVREKLKSRGYSFVSNSDSEVLVKAFHCWREQCVDYFIGMFAFAIYDERSDEIYLFRDRVGVKPLYYSYKNGSLFFASELKALMLLNNDKEIHSDAVSLYFRFGFIPQSLSIFASMRKLEPGNFLKVSRATMVKRQYWKLTFDVENGRSEDSWIDELEALLISAFGYRMVSDVPVGVFLSGGIDSSLLTAILQRQHGGIQSFNIGFEENKFDESVYASKVAEHLKTRHIKKVFKREEARAFFNQFYSIYDEPFADTSGIPISCVTQLAKEGNIKVVLSADGGDELFGGYTHYQKAIQLLYRITKMPYSFRVGLAKGIRLAIPPGMRRHVYAFNAEHKLYALEELLSSKNPENFFENFLANQSIDEIGRMVTTASAGSLANPSNGLLAPLQSMMYWDFKYYLSEDLMTKVDRATMYHSVESREPFLDHRLVEFAMKLPPELKIRDGKGKYLLRKLLNRYLPEKLFNRRKQGFSIPIFSWFSRELDQLFDEYFTDDKLAVISFFNRNEIRHEYKKYQYYKRLGKEYNIEKMWRILSFMLWWEKYMNNEK